MRNIQSIRILLLLSCVLCITGCSDDEKITLSDNGTPVKFGVASMSYVRTSVGGTKWVTGDKIGIFMIGGGQSLGSGILDGVDNRQYEAAPVSGNEATASFTPVIPAQTIYYPQDGSNVDFVAYYPYKTSLTGYVYPVDVTIQTNPADIDVLYSDNATGYNKNSSTVGLQFNHALSKVNFTLQPGDGMTATDLVNATVAMSNLNRTADLDLADGTLGNLNSSGVVTAYNNNEYAIVIPQTINNTNKLTVTLADNSEFETTLPAAITEFETGKQYNYTVTISKTKIDITIGNITDWTGKDDPAATGTANVVYELGNYYPDPDVDLTKPAEIAKITGIVYWVDSDQKHGRVISVDEVSVKWSSLTESLTGLSSDNGLINMNIIYNLHNTFAQYPAFDWVHSKNPAGTTYSDPSAKGIWYLPAVGEMNKWGSPSFWTQYDLGRAAFNQKLTDIGAPVINDVNNTSSLYWTSSQHSSTNAYPVRMTTGFAITGAGKASSNKTRAILSF